jgi:hypothetical protein
VKGGIWVLVSAFGVLAGCLEGTPPLDRIVVTVAVVSGDDQEGVVGKQLSAPMVAVVKNAAGSPIPNAIVNFVVVKGGGSVFAGTAESNASGTVQELWTLGTSTADSQLVEVRAVNSTTGQPQVYGRFVAKPKPDVPAAIMSTGSGQTASAGSALPDSLLARVLDQYGNAVPGVSVTWAIASGGGTLTALQSTSSATGHVSAKWMVGTIQGSGSVTVTAGMLQGSFAATIVAAAPAQIVGYPATVIHGGAGTTQLVQARVTDAFGNPSAGVAVTFCQPNGASDCSDVSRFGKNSDASGLVSFDATMPCNIAEPRDARFMAPFDTTNLTLSSSSAGPVHVVNDTSGNVQRQVFGQPGSALPLAIRAMDYCNNPVPNAPIALEKLVGTGTVPSSTVTGADGLGRFDWVLGPEHGHQRMRTATSDTRGLVVQYTAIVRYDSPSITLSAPLTSSTCCPQQFGDTLATVVLMTSTHALGSVKVMVSGRELGVPVAGFEDGSESVKISLEGLPFDTMTVVILAEDVNGNKESQFYKVRHFDDGSGNNVWSPFIDRALYVMLGRRKAAGVSNQPM